jgi:very-short-patch-repair endonuclease
VVEIDGAGHGWNDAAVDHGARRDAYMKRLGLRVLRIPAGDIFANPDEIAERLKVLALRMTEARKARKGQCGVGPHHHFVVPRPP